MLRFVTILLLLGLLSGLAWLGFSFYKVSHGFPAFPIEGATDRLEQFLNTADYSSELVGHLSSFVEKHEGKCTPMVLPRPNEPNGMLKPVPGKRFPFAQMAVLENIGALCDFPSFGKRTMFTPVLPETGFTLRRRWDKPPALTLDQGGLQIGSELLDLEWRAPGLVLALRSEGKAQLGIRHEFGMVYLSLQSGKFQLEILKIDTKTEVPAPIMILTSTTASLTSASLTSAGALVVSNGESIKLLPSGFTEKSAPPPEEVK